MSWKNCPEQTKMDRSGLKEMLHKIHNSSYQFLQRTLVLLTDLTAGTLGHLMFRRHFHFLLSVLLLTGPVLSLWVSKYSIFANKNHYLYRVFVRSCWGWTCVFCGSFVFLLSYSISKSLIHSARHLSRLAVSGTLWPLFRRLLSLLLDASGSCFEPLQSSSELLNSDTGPLLLLREEKGKAACLKAGLRWQGFEVSDEIMILTFCCLILAEESAVFGSCRGLGTPLGAPLRILFTLCVLLMSLWMFLILCLEAHFPLFPSQQIGGALGYLGWKGLYKGLCVLKPGRCCLGDTKASHMVTTHNSVLNG